MSNLYGNCPSHWHSNGQQYSDSLSKGLSLKVNSPPQLHLNVGFHLQDQDSPSSQSSQSNHGFTANAGTNSRDQCLSSESGQEVSCGQNQGQLKPVYLMAHPEATYNTGQIDYSRAMACMPYSCGDPYYNGLLSGYGAAPVIQPQMMGLTTARVPLPLDISEDEPIYVNAKQYNGILRRRQSRAKMEAQNKLIKARKPYLHESRHLHALKRVRGTGGRFLGTKKQQQSDSTSENVNHKNIVFESHQSQCMATGSSSISSNNAFFQQQDSGLSSHTGGTMQLNRGFVNSPNQQAPVVR